MDFIGVDAMKKLLFITISAIALFGCEDDLRNTTSPSSQNSNTKQTTPAPHPVKLTQQDSITAEFLSSVLTNEKLTSFQSGTRNGEEAKDQFYSQVKSLEADLKGVKAVDWVCTIADGFGGNITLPIDFSKNWDEYSKVSCYGHYQPKGQVDGRYRSAYELEHYYLYVNQQTQQSLKKLYNGDVIKFTGTIRKVDVGYSVQQGSITFDNVSAQLLK